MPETLAPVRESELTDSPDRAVSFEPENIQLASNLHTLLLSFPPGHARKAAVQAFPELAQNGDEPFDVFKNIQTPGSGPSEQHALLGHLLSKAEWYVGGSDRAETILNYPCITLDEDFSQVRPAHKDWVEVAEAANKRGPQMDLVITAKTGKRIFEDISAGRADWNDLVFSYLDRDQIAREKALVAELHSAFRSNPAMPSGHNHPSMAYVIPDTRFGHLWRMTSQITVNMGRSVAAWSEHSEGVSLPSAAELVYDGSVITIDPANAERLNALFGDRRFKPYVDAFIQLYTAAEEVIDSEKGKTLLKRHRQQMNTKRLNSPNLRPEGNLRDLVTNAVRVKADDINSSGTVVLPSNIEDIFMTNLTSGEEVAPEYAN